MNNVFETFRPEAFFSPENPFFKSVQKTHELIAEVFDQSARLQLTLAEELLDLNQKRFASLYAGEPLPDTLSAQKDVLTETGQRLSVYAEGIQDVVSSFQNDLGETVSEWTNAASNVAGAAPQAVKKAAKKTKAKAA